MQSLTATTGSKQCLLRLTIWAALAATLVACGSSQAAPEPGGSTDTGSPSAEAPDESASEAAAGGDFAAVESAASEEGAVNLYTSQPIAAVEAMVDSFNEVYPGITVQIVRATDGELAQRIDAEETSGNATADVWVTSSQQAIEEMAGAADFLVEPQGPGFESEAYLDQYIRDGNFFEVGAAILTFGWNTDLHPEGLEEYTDLIDPALADGNIAVIDANCCSAAVDFYLYLEEQFGEEFIADLAAQDPRIYPSALPIGEALSAGEVAAAAFTLPLDDQIEQGAPVNYSVSDQAWGTRFFGGVLSSAPNPNAALALANFMVSEEGQTQLAAGQSAVLPGIDGALTTNDQVREQDMSALTPDKVADYQAAWNEMFK